MSHPLPYSIPYITAPTPQYMYPTHAHHTHTHVPGAVHMVSPAQIRADPPQRKRPKYTRSKTGCLTCRAKKIKCDEGKPNCHRCEHAHRECTWPDPAPTKKKTPTRKNSATQDNSSLVETASRTSGSSASRDPTPNTRDNDSRVNPSPIVDSTRRYSGPHGYAAYVESGAPTNNRQIDSPYSTQTEPCHTTGAINSATGFSSSYSYDFHPSPNGSLSSRSNSRPSTANSLPPSHFNVPSNHAAIDSRDYPRWEVMHTGRADYTYYTTA